MAELRPTWGLHFPLQVYHGISTVSTLRSVKEQRACSEVQRIESNKKPHQHKIGTGRKNALYIILNTRLFSPQDAFCIFVPCSLCPKWTLDRHINAVWVTCCQSYGSPLLPHTSALSPSGGSHKAPIEHEPIKIGRNIHTIQGTLKQSMVPCLQTLQRQSLWRHHRAIA